MKLDLDLENYGALQQQFEDLQERGEADAVFSVGSNTDYGVILEFGRGPIEAEEGYLRFEVDGEVIFRKRVSGHPPYPWFRPAIREFRANPQRFILDNTGYSSIEEIPNANELVRAVANALQNQMVANASANSASDRSPGTHPEHPERDTGNLVGSIQAVRIN